MHCNHVPFTLYTIITAAAPACFAAPSILLLVLRSLLVLLLLHAVALQVGHLPADGVQVQAADIADPASNIQEAKGGDLQQIRKNDSR